MERSEIKNKFEVMTRIQENYKWFETNDITTENLNTVDQYLVLRKLYVS